MDICRIFNYFIYLQRLLPIIKNIYTFIEQIIFTIITLIVLLWLKCAFCLDYYKKKVNYMWLLVSTVVIIGL